VELAIPVFSPRPQSITALWLVLMFHPAEDRRLSWPDKETQSTDISLSSSTAGLLMEAVEMDGFVGA